MAKPPSSKQLTQLHRQILNSSYSGLYGTIDRRSRTAHVSYDDRSLASLLGSFKGITDHYRVFEAYDLGSVGAKYLNLRQGLLVKRLKRRGYDVTTDEKCTAFSLKEEVISDTYKGKRHVKVELYLVQSGRHRELVAQFGSKAECRSFRRRHSLSSIIKIVDRRTTL